MNAHRPERVIVVGAGIVGLCTAFELTEIAGKDLSLTVIDPHPVGAASHYAGGMLAPVAEVQYRQEALYPLMLESARLYPSLIRRVSAATDLPTGYREEGTLVVAADRADAHHLRNLTAHQQAHGMAVKPLTVREARKVEPALSPALAGAVSIPGDTQVAPRLFAAALMDALRRRGVTFLPATVTRMGENEVRTDRGGVDTRGARVVLSAGLGAARLTEGLALRPVYGDILIARAPGLIERVVRGFVEDRPVYLIPRGETVAIGATSREDHRAGTPLGSVRDLLRDSCRIVPALEEADLLEWGTGARPGTPDDLPYLGRVGNTVISTGYFRHGILLAALGGLAGARLALGESPGFDLGACDPRRHRAHHHSQPHKEQ
ncbi:MULTISPECIES: glycine oxidase ThiO [unclassified Corynebacterium]|uniref:glycine oxidase ThiO n=1 Tax=unclassified Corynebacterium TaxID=2624378 RepID=UPI0029CA5F0C|nr:MULTISPECIES: glycine oxidase ThiO [unclassified Corynebacterium]WPF65338.1 glycine oxidase ThiO [Corynebacterium sp. 22KM0430]WPF67833.1 glycine oxidase ThiO [Corynebacterium sp. 21KM1197]